MVCTWLGAPAAARGGRAEMIMSSRAAENSSPGPADAEYRDVWGGGSFTLCVYWLMPFKSKAQRRKFAELLVEGKITDEQYEEWNRSTGKKVLPERLHPKKGEKKTTSRKRGARKRTKS